MMSESLGSVNRKAEEIASARSESYSRKSEVVRAARSQANDVDEKMGESLGYYETQESSTRKGIGRLKSTADNPDVPRSERKKAKGSLDQLQEHSNYVGRQARNIRRQMSEKKSMIWFHAKTRNEMIEINNERAERNIRAKHAEKSGFTKITGGLIPRVQQAIALGTAQAA